MISVAPALLSTLEIVGWSLLHFLWQGCLIGAFYALVRRLLPTDRAELRYAAGLSALALMALCLPVTAAFLLSLESMSATAGVSAVGSMESMQGGTATTAFNLDALMPALVTLWIAGVVLFAFRAIREMRSYSRIISQASPADSGLAAMLARVAERIGYMGRVRVLISEHVDTPTLFGWLRPVVLLPVSVALNFPREQVELILAHELGHLRRYDHYVNLAQTVVETLLFYHPVVHWIARDVRHEREVCCDHLVLGIDRVASREYVRTLAALQDLRLQPSPLVLAANGGYLLDRVQRILLDPVDRPLQPRSNAAYWVLLTVLIGGALLMTTRLQAQREALERLGQSLLEKLPRPPALIMAELALDVSKGLEISPPARSRWLLPDVDVAATAPVDAIVSAPQLRLDAVPAPDARLGLVLDVGELVMPRMDDIASAENAAIAALPASTSSASASAPASMAVPVIVRRVTPQYPNATLGDSQGHVQFEFTLAADGSVRDVHVVSGDAVGRFAEEARKALVQWKFDPLTVVAGSRLRQDFEFRQSPAAATNTVGCQRGTGSHICQSRTR